MGEYLVEIRDDPPHLCDFPIWDGIRERKPILSDGSPAGVGTQWKCSCGRIYEVRKNPHNLSTNKFWYLKCI